MAQSIWVHAEAGPAWRAELPRDVREALVSWNHAQEYDCPTYEDYAARLAGGGQFEKVYDLGAAPSH